MSYFVNNEWSKNRYQTLHDFYPHESRTMTRSIFTSAIIGFCFTLIILLLWNASRYQKASDIYVVYLDANQHDLHVTSDKFLSFGLDSSLLRRMNELPIYNERFVTLSRHLQPAFVRIGGTSADCLYFNESTAKAKKIRSPVDGQDISKFTLAPIDFYALYNYAKEAGLRMIFDLNVLIRNEQDFSWNYTNAKEIISYARNNNMDLDWQLGNEPNSFHHVFNVTITAEQLGKDYSQLKSLLNEAGYQDSLLVGPEVNHVGDPDHRGEDYATTFLNNDENDVDFVTWHQYYLNGHTAELKDFINPATFDYLPTQITSMNNAINASGKSIPMWLSETSTAYGGGAPNLSDRFVAGFLWLDKLGYSASTGVNVVIRQSLFGGDYAMIGPDILPNPDWWVSIFYKQFVSEKVLRLNNNHGFVRLYAHCTPKNALVNRVPAVTIYGINLDTIPRRIVPSSNSNVRVFLYTLTSDYLSSRKIRLNGQILKLRPNGDLPPFPPIILEPKQPIVIPSYSMVFIILHGLEVPACLS